MFKKKPNREKHYYRYVLVQHKNKEIYYIKTVQNLQITVETKHTTAHIQQCNNCQRYRHHADHCRLSPRCPKTICRRPPFLQVQKPLTVQAKYCNCNGEHPANVKCCPKNPNNSKPKQQKEHSTAPPRKPSTPRTENISYAAITQQQYSPAPVPNHHYAIIKQMKEATAALTEFLTNTNQRNIQH